MIRPKRVNCVKVLSCDKSQSRELSRHLVTFFTCTQLIFGFNFGFVGSNGRFEAAARLVTIVVGSIMIVALILSLNIEVIGNNTYFFHFVQYLSFFIILLCAKYTLYDFLIDLPSAREETKRECKIVEALLLLYAVLLFGGKMATAILYCSLLTCTNIRWSIIDAALHAPKIALDIMPIASFIMFYHVYACMKDMTVTYEHREISLEQLQNTFKEVADKFQKFRCNYDAIFVIWFLTESIKWMITIWHHLTLVTLSGSSWLLGCSYTWALFGTIQICAPAVYAEMITVQIEAMKLKLNDELLSELDDTKKTDLLCLLRYVEARPLLRKAWRLVPVDLRLPVSMLSICTTYLIVIIQFTHMFD